ncbi:DNA gyrase subunit B, partial [Streptomyces sp. SID6041]|nr:DNA gyrase subunit B [Streptomyces sp. SID6041]
GLEAIRKRPGMYVGSTGRRGLHFLVYGAVGRALRRGEGSVDVTLLSDGGVRVSDDGPGTPFETAAGDLPGLEDELTRLCGGGEPDGHRAVWLDHFGVGLSVVNALSTRLTAEVRREGVRATQEYARGVALAPPRSAGPATGTGTTLVFRPDAEIFETTECAYDELAERFAELALLNRGLRLSLTDERRPGTVRTERFAGGVRDLVALLETPGGAPVSSDVLVFETEDPGMAGSVEVGLRWSGSGTGVRGFANSLRTHEGGAHIEGFRAGLAAAVTAYARERRLLTAADPALAADRIDAGLTAVVSVKLDRPEFQGATRTCLVGAEVRSGVEDTVRDHVRSWLEGHPEEASAVVRRVARGADREADGA